VSKRIDDVHKRLDDLHRRLEDLRGEMVRGFADVYKRFDDLRGEMNRRFEELTTRVARVEDRLWWIVGIQVGTWITVMLAILFRR
jgi:tetrahydromethanopterin S-methyltransferase subunit G